VIASGDGTLSIVWMSPLSVATTVLPFRHAATALNAGDAF
jgi:hypothetical protein